MSSTGPRAGVPFVLHDFTVGGDHGTPIVAVEGELDIFTAPEFRERLFARLEGGSGDLIVDFSACRFVDSTACAALLGAGRRARARGGSVVVVRGDAEVARVFGIMGLEELFPMADSREEAAALVRDR